MHTAAWRARGAEPRGIITGCDAGQEIFLPWWWWQTRSHTDLSVLFVDFGMSEAGRRFCEERGEVVTLPPADFVVGMDGVSKEHIKQWDRVFTHVWHVRPLWFLKPFALLASSFGRALWLDIDCALCAPLEALFDEFQGELCLAPEEGSYYSDHGLLPVGAISYNTGVILFQHGTPLISRWAERGVRENDRVLTEQILLNRMAFEGDARIEPLPKRYNWNMRHAGLDEIAIAHYVGNGKEKICDQIHLLESLRCIQRLK